MEDVWGERVFKTKKKDLDLEKYRLYEILKIINIEIW